MKLTDLSPAEQRQIRTGGATVVPRRSPNPTRRRRGALRTLPSHRCGRCKAEFVGYDPAERHVDEEHRVGRIEVIE